MKRIFINLGKSVCALALGSIGLATAPLASANTTNVNVHAVSIHELTATERNAVQYGVPQFVANGEQPSFVLVYQPKAKVAAAKTAIGPLGRVLPRTGSTELDVTLYGLGAGVLALAGWLVYKNKKSGKTLLVAVLTAGGLGFGHLADADFRNLLNTQSYQVQSNGQIVTVTPQVIEGYEYVGYLTTSYQLQTPQQNNSIAAPAVTQATAQISKATSQQSAVKNAPAISEALTQSRPELTINVTEKGKAPVTSETKTIEPHQDTPTETTALVTQPTTAMTTPVVTTVAPAPVPTTTVGPVVTQPITTVTVPPVVTTVTASVVTTKVTKPIIKRMFNNCTEVRKAGLTIIRRGDEGFGPHLDRDGDGEACELNSK